MPWEATARADSCAVSERVDAEGGARRHRATSPGYSAIRISHRAWAGAAGRGKETRGPIPGRCRLIESPSHGRRKSCRCSGQGGDCRRTDCGNRPSDASGSRGTLRVSLFRTYADSDWPTNIACHYYGNSRVLCRMAKYRDKIKSLPISPGTCYR